MTTGPFEPYVSRSVIRLGQLSFPGVEIKAYGLTATGQALQSGMQDTARDFVESDVLNAVAETGDSNGMGFMIIHPGSLGLSISAHWWTQGSVLCQMFYRKLYDADTPLNMAARPSIGCVWELALIEQETDIWKRTMMSDAPDPAAYMSQFADVETV